MTMDGGVIKPVFFGPNRVWRCYVGGKLLDEFLGLPSPGDGHFPEEWLASAVRAENGTNRQGPDEGISRVINDDGTPGAFFSEDSGVLCKFLDSAVRLPIQCHPDREFARIHYKSAHGKEEAWFILGIREINGQKPYLLAGFKPGVKRRDFRKAVFAGDSGSMAAMLHRIEVKPGDAFYIPGRFPHAIGPGVFMLEVQEPSDWVVQPEPSIADYRLSNSDMWGPLDPETGLDCFDYSAAAGLNETLCRISLATADGITLKGNPRTSASAVQSEVLVGSGRTASFSVKRTAFCGSMNIAAGLKPQIAIVTKGDGIIATSCFYRHIRQGSCFFIPACADAARIDDTPPFHITAAGSMTVYLATG